jgi:hypothetical protein
LNKDVATEEKTQEENQKTRNGEKEEYAKKRQDLVDAVDAVVGALDAMQTAKADVEEEITSLLQKLPAQSLSSTALALISSASSKKRGAAPGEAKAYKYDSKEVIETLKQLTMTFKKELADLDEDEISANSAFEMAYGARANTITAYNKQINEKETLSAAKSEEKSEKEELKKEEEKDRAADQAFLDDLTSKCNAKAKAWDQRSTTRATELTALTQGVELLKGMGDKYSANSKLVGLITKKAQPDIGKHAKPVFLQLRSVRHQNMDNDQFQQLTSQLSEKARTLKSTPLAMLALQLQSAGPDHFVKVRGIIKDLIAKLEADAKAEATSKGICDKNMASAIDKRDTSAAAIETANAQIDATEATISALKTDIEDLAGEIAKMNKDLLEATELRANEKAENEKTIKNAEEGGKAVDQAIVLLKKFYEGAFLQAGAGQTPNIENRDGQTVGDLAPETFSSDEEYKGKIDASKGIIGMLEVISSDFARTVKTVTDQEAQAVKDYETVKKDLEKSISDKEKTKTDKEGEVETKESDLTGFKDDLKDASKRNELALTELEKLKASCVDGEETYAERVAKRKEEIEALKEAMQILEDWQSTE